MTTLPATALPGFFTLTWPANFPAGPYTFFLAVTLLDAFADGLDLGDFVVAAQGPTFTP